MGTISASSNDVTSPLFSESPSTASMQSSSSPPSVTMETQAPSPQDVLCSPSEDSTEEGWWQDAEEFDLTFLSEVSFRNAEDHFNETAHPQHLNETYDPEVDCNFFLQFPPPPKWGNLPPPPIPPILEDLLRQDLGEGLQRIPTATPQSSEEAHRLSSKRSEEVPCSLCGWVKGQNETLNLFSKKHSGQLG